MVTTANGAEGETPPQGLEDEIDALYRGPRERFVPERNALAKRLHDGGHGPHAARIKALVKPSVSAWAVAQLWWTRREDTEALRRAGRRQLVALHTGAGPAEQAAAGRERRKIHERLVDAAAEMLAAAGHAAGASTLRRISITLEALAAHGPDGGPHPGRLSEDLDPPGFERVGPPAVPFDPDPEPPEPRDEDQAALAEAERAVDDVRGRAQHAARRLDGITRDAENALLLAERADQEHQRATLVAQRAAKAAESAMLAARRAQAEAARHVGHLEEIRRALEGLTLEQRRLEDQLRVARERCGDDRDDD
ncbi:MAG: hypothetical protein H6712_32685 [Myxococcales bacterium]|nr:hypothetical protein [Myxococcales bacterium]MCB9718653.1 hypothetical protein [Myxococcales bacterium]